MSDSIGPLSGAASSESQRRAVRVRRVIEDCMRRRAAGEAISDDDVASSHADLMPELREELSLLSVIERARRSAQSPSSVDLDAGHTTTNAGDVRRLLDVRGFDVTHELHRGGQGIVFEAMQRTTGRSVAVKVLHESGTVDPRGVARFEREARILAMIDHPNVVKVIDSGTIAGRRYIAMDLVRGIAWTEYERSAVGDEGSAGRTGPEARGVLRRFRTICDAVSAAHLRGVIHRDLKPGNILIDENGQPRVLDFGLAKLTEAGELLVESMTRDGQFVGSLPWASPEQAAGEVDMLDVRSDVYSLGVVLFQALTGTFPYPVEGNWRAVADAIANTTPAALRTLRPDIDPDVEKILLTCLEKEPARRYQSVSQLGEDVRRFLAGEPILARGGGTIYVLRRLAMKHRAIVAVTMSFLVLVVVLAITTSFLYGKERRALARADEERRQADLARDAALKDRRQAVLEAERATAVEAFLRGVLSGADPRRMGKDITVAELLDRASQSAEYFKALEGKPLVEAAVRQAMGETYYGLGMNDRAEAEFRRALALESGEESESGVSEDAVQTMHSLATVLYSLGEYGEAQDVIERAMSAMGVEPETPIRDEPTAELISLHSVILSAQGKFDHLIDNAERRLDYYRRLYGAGDWRTLYAMNDLSYAYDCNQRYEDAVDTCREALELCRGAKGPDDPLTLTIRMNLAIALGKLNRTDEVESIVRETLEARRRILPPDHPVLADTLVEWAKICVSGNDTDGACAAIEEALGIQVRALGADHPKIAGTRVQLASLYVHLQRYDDAETQLISAFEYLKDHACEQPDVVDGLKTLALKAHQSHGTSEALDAWKTRLHALNCESQAP